MFKMYTTIVRQCVDLIKTALSQVELDYFKLETNYEPPGIVRERVFCYEFYHQIRKIMTDSDLKLNSEIDKRGHPDFAPGGWKNPDFVIHTPGTHENNTFIIEVKGKLEPKKIGEDIKKIITFIEEYQYKAGVFVLYNHSLESLKQSAGQLLRNYNSRPSANSVHILAIENPGMDCEELLLSELSE